MRAVSTMFALHETLLSVMRTVMEQVAAKRVGQTFRAASLSARCSTWDFRPKPRAIASVAFNPPDMMFDTACLASLASFAGKMLLLRLQQGLQTYKSVMIQYKLYEEFPCIHLTSKRPICY